MLLYQGKIDVQETLVSFFIGLISLLAGIIVWYSSH